MVPPMVAGNLDWGRDSGGVCFALLARVENNKKDSLLIRTIHYSRREFLFLASIGSYMACMIRFRKMEFHDVSHKGVCGTFRIVFDEIKDPLQYPRSRKE